MSWCNVLRRAGSDYCVNDNFPGTFVNFCLKIFTQERILTIKENLPSCTLIVILFLEQGVSRVEIRTLQTLHAHPIRIQFSQPSKIFQLLNLRREGGKALISTPCSRNRITIKVQLGKFSLIVKILFPQLSVFEGTLQPEISHM